MKKFFVFLMAIFAGIFFTTTLNAQSDGFFRGGNDSYQNRADEIQVTGGINNNGIGQSEPVPVSGGRDPERAKNLRIASDNMYTDSQTNRFRGNSVRLVRPATK